MRIFCLLLVFARFLTIFCTLNNEIILKFCQSRHLYSVTIFCCNSKPERARLFKKITTNGINTLMIKSGKFTSTLQDSATAVVADGNCAEFPSFIAQVEEKYFFEKYHWLIITNNKLEDFREAFKNVALNINSNVHLAVFNSSTNWLIYDIYNQAYRHDGKLRIIELGLFNSTIGYPAKPESNKYWIRRNMSGVNFKSAVVVPNPRIKLNEYLYSDEHRQENSMHRFQSTTVRYCRDFFNFTLNIQRTHSWGYRQQNGRFDGLVGLLARKLVDFGSSPLLLKFDRLPYVDYSYGNWILRSAFIYRRPKTEAASYEIFLRPLSDSVWICILCFQILIILLLKIIISQEKKLYNKSNGRIDNNWSSSLLSILGVFCQQGSICHPRLFSSRTLLIFTLLFSVLIYQFYSASIVSYLLMEPPRMINNLQDLVDSNMKAGIEDILIDRNYFKQTTDPIAIDLYNRKIKGQTNNSGFYQPHDGLNLVKIGGFAYHVETSTAYPIIGETFTNQEICELEEVQLYPTQPMYTNLQKHSPFREMMNYCMLKLVDKGIMYRLRNHWDTRKPICIKSMKADDINVNLHEFSCALIVLACGSCLSLTLLICELLYIHKIKSVKTLTKQQTALLPFSH